MINTANRRRASIAFGFMPSAGTLIPSGTSTEFRRGSALSLYPRARDVFALISNGWSFGSTGRVFRIGATDRIFSFAANVVWNLRRRR